VASQFRSALKVRACLRRTFPKLKKSTWRIKSPLNDNYQCIAWAAVRTDVKWWPVDGNPSVFWPDQAPLDESIEAFTKAFQTIGYATFISEKFEFGFQTVAMFATNDGLVRHMARQHFFGIGWLSKCGNLEDILHFDLRAVEGDPSAFLAAMGFGTYGQVCRIMRRPWAAAVREGGLLRMVIAAASHFSFRLRHPSWIYDNIRRG
jgi:hypothetical protein